MLTDSIVPEKVDPIRKLGMLVGYRSGGEFANGLDLEGADNAA